MTRNSNVIDALAVDWQRIVAMFVAGYRRTDVPERPAAHRPLGLYTQAFTSLGHG